MQATEHRGLYPFQGACVAAQAQKRDMFTKMVHELVEMLKEKRTCDENISDLSTKQKHEATKVPSHANESVYSNCVLNFHSHSRTHVRS